MGMPLSELLRRMSGEELALHWAQYRAQPWGPERDEVNTAVIAWNIARFAGKVAKKAPKFEDFLTYGRPVEEDPDPLEFAKRRHEQ